MTSMRRGSRSPRARSHSSPSRTSSSSGVDERDAELTREPCVLPVGGVVLAVGQHRGLRRAAAAGALRRGGAQGVGQQVDLAVERARRRVGRHGDVLEQRAAGRVQVGEAARRADVVLQHEPFAVVVAHEVQPGDADPDAARRLDAAHRRLVVVGGGDDLARDDALGDDPLVAVDVGDEGVQGAHALGEAALDGLPVGRGDHARDGVDVELVVALDRREAHAGALQRAAHAAGQVGGVGARDGLDTGPGVRAGLPGRGERFVEDSLAHRVVGEEVIRAQGGHRPRA